MKPEEKIIQDLHPIGSALRADGWSDRRLDGLFRKILDLRSRNTYADFIGSKQIAFETLQSVKRDSTAEGILYEYLKKNGIDFKFQYRIGKYRVDFFVPDNLVIELDGPHHEGHNQKKHDQKRDAYIRSLGYEMIRIPVLVMTYDPGAVVDEIKNYKQGGQLK
jgi:very-short-patch-repair endonuclease